MLNILMKKKDVSLYCFVDYEANRLILCADLTIYYYHLSEFSFQHDAILYESGSLPPGSKK